MNSHFTPSISGPYLDPDQNQVHQLVNLIWGGFWDAKTYCLFNSDFNFLFQVNFLYTFLTLNTLEL